MKNKILTFGEPLLINYITKNTNIPGFSESYFSYGGSEINTAVSLSNLGCKVFLLSIFPDNEMSEDYLETIEKIGIDTRFIIIKKNEEFGSMYVRNNNILYQRYNSAFSKINLSDIDIENVFKIDYDWIHLTGITPLINDNCKKVWIEILEKSFEKNLPVSLNLNYKEKLGPFYNLWEIVKPYLSRLDTLIISRDELEYICDLENFKLDDNIDKNLKDITYKFNINKLVISIKKKKVNNSMQISQDRFSVMCYLNKIYRSNIKNHIPIELIGGGDSFSGCLINSLLDYKSKQTNIEILNKADIYTIINQERKGNFSIIKKEEFKSLFKIYDMSFKNNDVIV